MPHLDVGSIPTISTNEINSPFRRVFSLVLDSWWESNGTFAPLVRAKVRGFGGSHFLYRHAIENDWRRRIPTISIT